MAFTLEEEAFKYFEIRSIYGNTLKKYDPTMIYLSLLTCSK